MQKYAKIRHKKAFFYQTAIESLKKTISLQTQTLIILTK